MRNKLSALRLGIHIKLLLLIFLSGLAIRFLFFPGDIYFGFDQARDAFMASEILKGDIKILGPSTSREGLYHGVFYYYLIAPVYFLAGGDPLGLSIFIRVINTLGILLVFFLGFVLFNYRVGLIASFLFAFSFEQTQYALYMSNPAPASLSVMLFFLGLSLVIFRRIGVGLVLTALGLGLSIQFEFGLIYLLIPFLILVALNFKNLLGLGFKSYLLSGGVFLISISSFLVAELIYNFRTLKVLTEINPPDDLLSRINSFWEILLTLFKFNITGETFLAGFIMVGLLFLVSWLFYTKKTYRKQLTFLLIWFFTLIPAYFLSDSGDLIYTYIGISISLIIIMAFVINLIFTVQKPLAWLLIFALVFINLSMIFKYNKFGTVKEIHVQQKMLLKDELVAIDYTYANSGGGPFAVKAVTMPRLVNTLWSYLYEWYGMNKYGYLPVWGWESAEGYPGNLQVIRSQTQLPNKQFMIIESTRGIPEREIEDYFRVEGYFNDVLKEASFGSLVVQERVKK